MIDGQVSEIVDILRKTGYRGPCITVKGADFTVSFRKVGERDYDLYYRLSNRTMEPADIRLGDARIRVRRACFWQVLDIIRRVERVVCQVQPGK